MKWTEIRQLYPNKFIKFEVIDYHTVGNKRYVDEIAVIKVIDNGREL